MEIAFPIFPSSPPLSPAPLAFPMKSVKRKVRLGSIAWALKASAVECRAARCARKPIDSRTLAGELHKWIGVRLLEPQLRKLLGSLLPQTKLDATVSTFHSTPPALNPFGRAFSRRGAYRIRQARLGVCNDPVCVGDSWIYAQCLKCLLTQNLLT